MSQSEASEGYQRGIVFVNHEEVTKIDKRIDEGIIRSSRGKGAENYRACGLQGRGESGLSLHGVHLI